MNEEEFEKETQDFIDQHYDTLDSDYFWSNVVPHIENLVKKLKEEK